MSIRGSTITGDITVFGSDFGMAYSVAQGDTQINGNAVAFLRNALELCEPYYAALLSQLVTGPLSVESIHDEADRLLSVAGDAIDGDPYRPEPAADLIGAIKTWWQARHASVTAQIAAH